MTARKRSGWSVVSPGRLAEIIERMSARAAARAPGPLGARRGAGRHRRARRAPGGPAALRPPRACWPSTATTPTTRPCIARRAARRRDGSIGHLEVWGAPDEDDRRGRAAPGGRRLRPQPGDHRHRARARRRAHPRPAPRRRRDRRARAARSARGRGPRARRRPAPWSAPRPRCWWPRARRRPRSPPTTALGAALRAEDLAALVPPERPRRARRGPRLEGPALPRQRAARARASPAPPWWASARAPALGVLVVFGDTEMPVAQDDLEALVELAGHVATALTMSILRQEVRELGAVDPTTRFYNARYFQSRLDQECQRALRAGVPLSVAIMSLDGLAEMRERGDGGGRRGRRGGARRATWPSACATWTWAAASGDNELAVILPEVEGLDALRVGERPRATIGAAPAPGRRVHPLGGRRQLPLAGRPAGEPDRQRRARRWSGPAPTAATAPSSSTPTPPRSCAARARARRPTTRRAHHDRWPWWRRSTPATRAPPTTPRTSAASRP